MCLPVKHKQVASKEKKKKKFRSLTPFYIHIITVTTFAFVCAALGKKSGHALFHQRAGPWFLFSIRHIRKRASSSVVMAGGARSSRAQAKGGVLNENSLKAIAELIKTGKGMRFLRKKNKRLYSN